MYEAFIAGVKKRLSGLKVGNALTPGIDIGPVASKEQLDTDLRYIEIGKSEGAELLFGGEQLQLQTQGRYLSPAHH